MFTAGRSLKSAFHLNFPLERKASCLLYPGQIWPSLLTNIPVSVPVVRSAYYAQGQIPCDRPEPPSPTRMDSSCMPKPACTRTAGDSEAKPPNPKKRERLVGVTTRGLLCLGVLGEGLLLPASSVLNIGSLLAGEDSWLGLPSRLNSGSRVMRQAVAQANICCKQVILPCNL